MKHVKIHHHFVREENANEDVEFTYCNKKEQYVNFLTETIP